MLLLTYLLTCTATASSCAVTNYRLIIQLTVYAAEFVRTVVIAALIQPIAAQVTGNAGATVPTLKLPGTTLGQ